MRNIIRVSSAPEPHWVGTGFLVRSLFSYEDSPQERSPFLLLDYGAPKTFTPTTIPRGVGEHPHRGFETVTIAYAGEIEHRDSSGGGGKIGPGDVQWMTAASGVLHDEYHSKDFSRTGGSMEMVQLWVNLPAALKMSAPRYQTLTNTDIPTVRLPNDGGAVRVIAGQYREQRGPAYTNTPMNVWDVRLRANHEVRFDVADGHTVMLVVLRGTLLVNAQTLARSAQTIFFERHGGEIVVEANSDAALLLLSGEPIDEPVVGHGPFVMNSEHEIRQAIDDYQQGLFGELA